MEENNLKRKRYMLPYFIFMTFLFIVLFILQQFGTAYLYQSFIYKKYGTDIIAEAIWAGIVLIIMLLWKNSYVFKQKRENFWDGVLLALPLIILSSIFLLIGFLTNIIVADKFVVLNLGIYCLFIGIVEEFLCRGWLLNEFLERFSDTKKGKLLSIILSSLIFGLAHYVNVLSGQTFIETTVQVLNATVSGAVFAIIYYRTSNIWCSVALHAFWDFSLMSTDLNSIIDCVSAPTTTSIIIYSCIQAVVLFASMGLVFYSIYRKTDLSDKEPLSKKHQKILYIVAVIFYLIGLLFLNSPDSNNTYCPEYETKSLGEELSVEYYSYNKFNFNSGYNNRNEYTIYYDFDLFINKSDNKLVLKNNISDEEVAIFDGNISSYLLIENNNNISILIKSDSGIVNYVQFNKNLVSNEISFMNYVKDSIKEYVVPDISRIGIISKKDSNYKYPMIKTTLNMIMYFDEDGNLLFN